MAKDTTSLRARLLKNSTINDTALISTSKFFKTKDLITTEVPMINAALSGRVDGGLAPGLLMLAGPSKHFKSNFGLLMAKAFLDKNPDGTVLFYDSEFGSSLKYFESFGINPESVVHTPITNIEELKFDIMAQIDTLERADKVFIFIDSIGNLASKKEVQDAMDQKSVADMTRAKAFKSLFRMVTPHLMLKDIPMVCISHVYMTQEMYSKAIMSGGTGLTYAANDVWIIGRQQDKDGKELTGYNFVINIEKSRTVKEKSKIPISVSFEGGINRWSGMLELALEAGVVAKPKVGWYCRVTEDGEVLGKNYRADQIDDNDEFWIAVLKETKLAEFIKTKYSLANGPMIRSKDETAALEDYVYGEEAETEEVD